jgi:ABC-type antimicrobial peptide transport system permease subunit
MTETTTHPTHTPTDTSPDTDSYPYPATSATSADADLGGSVCALPGCENLLEPVDRGRARRYCCIAHRKIARRQRRETLPATPPAAPTCAATMSAAPVSAAGAAAVAGHQGPDSMATETPPPTWPVSYRATRAPLAPRTSPLPVPTTAAIPAWRGRAAAEGLSSYRRLVVQSRPRWFRRSCRPYAVRGVHPNRARYPLPPLPSHPEWLWPTLPDRPPRRSPRARRVHPMPPRPVRPPLPRAPLFVELPPPDEPSLPQTPVPGRAAQPVDAPRPVEAPQPSQVWQPLPTGAPTPTTVATPASTALPRSRTSVVSSSSAAGSVRSAVVAVWPLAVSTCRTLLQRGVRRFGAAAAERQDKSTQRRIRTQQRATEVAAARRDATALLRGVPLPADDPTVGGGRGARGRRGSVRPVELAAVAPAVWGAQMREALFAALRSLSSNQLRSLLTTIGIIAGVASVIMLVAMGDGMTKGFNDQWSKFATQITITPITGPVATGKAPQHLTDVDLRALEDPHNTPDIASFSPAVASNNVTLTVGGQKGRGQLFGIIENYLDLANRHMVAGDWFTTDQMSAGTRHAIIGPEVINELWGPGTDPNSVIGQPLRVGHSTFQIQGVVSPNGQADNVVMVPLDAARAFVVGNNVGKLDIIIAKATSIDTLEAAKNEIYTVLYTQHHVRVDTDRDFNVADNTDFLQQQSQSIRFLSMFILAIAAISLFVGGVGVANIMLVAVTERTREIGIRKAIGAPRRAIMRQFLSEAVMLTALGGGVGSVLGIGLCLIGKIAIPKLWPPDPTSLTPTPVPLLSLWPVLIAFGVSLLIGLLAGGYPAYRAARLRPIEALRFE